MADGSERPIESISVGEMVVSHKGLPRVVEHVIKKPYSGDLLTVAMRGYGRKVTCTPDHRIFTGGDGDSFWCSADSLVAGDEVLIPRYAPAGEEHVFDLADNQRSVSYHSPGRNVSPSSESKVRWLGMKHEVNRFIHLDSRLGWLIGLYLAEGSCDVGRHGPQRITFNLSAKERFLAELAVAFIYEVFGVEAAICQVPSKPSVLYVRFTSPPAANLFKSLAPGNSYSKRVAPVLFTAPRRVRASVLRGWYAGDGHFQSKRTAKVAVTGHDSVRATGVSVSGGLAYDMMQLANSCGAVASMNLRKARKASKEATSVVMYGRHAYEAFPGEVDSHSIKPGAATEPGSIGMWKKVSEVTSKQFTGDVYCLQVAEDHSFIAEGVAVHNCVARATAWAVLTSLALEVVGETPDEITGKRERVPEVPPKGVKTGIVSSSSIWAWRGYDSDGWICSESAKVASEKGFLLCKPYPDLKIDLTEYGDKSNSLGGSRPPSAAVLAEQKQHAARTATFLKGREQVRDFLAAGYGIFNCSAMAFERSRDDWGYSRQVGVWHHAQHYLGYDDRPETHKKWGQALVLWNNSHWGKWNTGPRKVVGTDLEIPHGTFWTLASTIDRASNIALSSVAGWPRRQHTTFGATGNV